MVDEMSTASRKPYYKKCAVLNCTNNFLTNSNITYHTFPSNDELFEEWKRKTNNPAIQCRTKRAILCQFTICGRHFENTCFQTTERKKLIRGAVPTLFLFSKDTTASQPSTRTQTEPSTSNDSNTAQLGSPISDVEVLGEPICQPSTSGVLSSASSKIHIVGEPTSVLSLSGTDSSTATEPIASTSSSIDVEVQKNDDVQVVREPDRDEFGAKNVLNRIGYTRRAQLTPRKRQLYEELEKVKNSKSYLIQKFKKKYLAIQKIF